LAAPAAGDRASRFERLEPPPRRRGAPTLPTVRLIADSLTGALESAAPFTALAGGIEVLWSKPAKLVGRGSFALDSQSRELAAAAAQARQRELAPVFKGADLAFKKIDSQLRGQVAAELAILWTMKQFRTIVIAPAFPEQGRVLVDGRLEVLESSGERRRVPVDLLAELRDLGVPARPVEEGQSLAPDGVQLCDASTRERLAAIAAAGPALTPPILWCGSAGLARALAGHPTPRPPTAWEGPWLALVGTTHPATLAQLDALRASRPDAMLVLPCDPTANLERLLQPAVTQLERGQGQLVQLDMPADQPRGERTALLDRLATAVVAALPRPGTLVVCGGEILLRLCRAEESESLFVAGEYAAGVPLAELGRGAWSGVRVVAKSDGFGEERFLADLVARMERDRA
jgi:uncharacterized protein YgbK (DUF1537 family)